MRSAALRPLSRKNIKNCNSLREKFQLNSGTRLDRFLAGIYDFYASKPLIFSILALELQVTLRPPRPSTNIAQKKPHLTVATAPRPRS